MEQWRLRALETYRLGRMDAWLASKLGFRWFRLKGEDVKL